MTTVNVSEHRTRLCKEGILGAYLQYAGNQESPQDFHTWVCISMIAIAMGRNCWCSMGMWETFPNLYVILVGESAITHKSTAINMGTRHLSDALPEIECLGDYMTAQALTSALAEMTEDCGKAEGYIEAGELSVMLDNAKKDDVFIKRITDFWDCPNRRQFRTIGRGKELVTNVCLNLLGGSTQKWLRSSIPEESLEGGFFSRLILVYRPPKGEKNSRPTMTAVQREAIEQVKNDLICIRNNMSGEFIIEEDAQQFFDEWYHDHNHPAKAEGFMRGYYGRKGTFLQKIAMCISASYSDDMRVTLEDMMVAHRLLNENEVYAKNMVKYMGTTMEGQKNLYVLGVIRKSTVNAPPDDTSGYTQDEIDNETYNTVVKQGITHRELQQRVAHKFRKDELTMALEVLLDGEEIELKRMGRRGRKIYIYKGTEEEM